MDNKSKWKVIASGVINVFDTEEQADMFKCLCENHEEAHNMGQNAKSFEVIEYVEDESSCKDCGKTLPICACAIENEDNNGFIYGIEDDSGNHVVMV